jgi:sulfate-transporting ATPase
VTDLAWPVNRPLPTAAAAAIHELGLLDTLRNRPGELSHGRRRLVSIARALAAAPSVLLLDEPAAGLDDESVANLGRLIRRLADDWGLAILVVEHDMRLVMETCDQIIALDFGRQICRGVPDAVRSDAALVAAYLGEPDRSPHVHAAAAAAAEVEVETV